MKTDFTPRTHGLTNLGNESWAYVEVRPNANMFYWLYRTVHPDGHTQRPLIMWLQVSDRKPDRERRSQTDTQTDTKTSHYVVTGELQKTKLIQKICVTYTQTDTKTQSHAFKLRFYFSFGTLPYFIGTYQRPIFRLAHNGILSPN